MHDTKAFTKIKKLMVNCFICIRAVYLSWIYCCITLWLWRGVVSTFNMNTNTKLHLCKLFPNVCVPSLITWLTLSRGQQLFCPLLIFTYQLFVFIALSLCNFKMSLPLYKRGCIPVLLYSGFGVNRWVYINLWCYYCRF